MDDVISRYLTAAARDETDTLVACFSPDAVVVDDGRTRHGREQIRAWRDGLSRGFDYTVRVLGTDGPHRVRTEVAGDFPGSPVELTYDFTLADGLISKLVIG